ncbi:MAG: hypothetical protein E7162_05280 [Firmicutes bacterium]|nr:hypothetical protein [Bacillota bacterium]
MNNNGERINKYNEVLIKYLNDLVTGLEPSNELNSELIESVTNNFKKQLSEVNLDIADDGVKTLLSNALKEYIKILKYHFDHSDIHKIDISHSNNYNINYEVSQVTNNLVNAANNINKIPEYINLVNRIKATLVGYFVQTFPNVEDVEGVSERIVKDCIISCLNNLSTSKIDEFNTNTLPTLISLGDAIDYVKEITQEDIEEANLKINDERDAFIYENMDVEIKEGFENGVVTLSVTDSMGKTTLYEGREAMEKLVSYNQLFEASRPGKKADISKWEHLLEKMYEEDALDEQRRANNPVEVPVDDGMVNNMDDTNSFPIDNTIPVEDTTTNINSNNASDLDIANTTNYEETNVPSEVAPPTVDIVVDDSNNNNSSVNVTKFNNNLIKDIASNPIYDSSYNIPSSSGMSEADTILSKNSIPLEQEPVNNTIDTSSNQNEQMIKNFLSNYDIDVDNNNNPTSTNKFITVDNSNEVESNINTPPTTNNFANDFLNATRKVDVVEEKVESKKDAEIQEIKSIMGIREENNVNDKEIYNGSFSFVPNFDNPNQERDDFIKRATGIDIEEDIDNQGSLYLKVTEPTGREQIYTGKEAINMIRNYNRTYLDANPGKKVDTSLIDRFE